MSTSTRQQLSIKHKLNICRAYRDRPAGITGRDVAETFGVGYSSLTLWLKQEADGLLSLENAIAVSRKPDSLQTGTTYCIDGKNFTTIDECKKYAVEKLGGIVSVRTVTESIQL